MKKGIILLAALSTLLPPQQLSFAATPAQIAGRVETLVETTVDSVLVMEYLNTRIQQFLDEETYDDEYWSVSVILPDSGAEISLGSDEQQTAASSVKLFVCGTVMENYEALCEQYGQDTVDYMLEQTLTISDNECATDLVIMLGDGDIPAGRAVVNEYCQRYGYSDSYVGIIFSGIDPDGDYNATTSLDTARFMSDLYNNKIPGAQVLLGYLKNSQRTWKIPAGLPDGVESANKTGELSNTENDTAIIFGEKTYILSVLSTEVEVSSAQNRIVELSQMVYEIIEEGSRS